MQRSSLYSSAAEPGPGSGAGVSAATLWLVSKRMGVIWRQQRTAAGGTCSLLGARDPLEVGLSAGRGETAERSSGAREQEVRLFVLLEKSSYLHQVMYGTGEYPEAKARLIDEEMVEAIGEWGKRRGGLARKGDATVGQRTRPGVPRGNRRAPGRPRGREAGAAGRVRPPRLLARRVRGVARSTFEEAKGCASDR